MSACTSTGQYAVAEGSSTTASGQYSHTEGNYTKASGSSSHAEGNWTTASGQYSHTEGNSTRASGSSSHAEGSGTLASGEASHAEGKSTTASGEASHAEGSGSTASGAYSHAEGNQAKASGDYSHVEGFLTSAATQSEHASGQFNISLSGSSSWGNSGNTLFTIGNGYNYSNKHNALQIMQDGTIYIVDTSGEGAYYQKPMIKLQDALANSGGDTPFTLTENNGATMSACTSTGQYAVAEGSGTTASGDYSHAEGSGTTASSWCSHAEGSGTTASGHASHAEGYRTSATTLYEHASGRLNNSLSGSSTWGDSGNTLFTVGNGYVTGSTSYTHNALQIMQNGDIYIADMSGSGEYYEKPMIKLQEIIKNLQQEVSTLKAKVATLEANEVTKAEVENGFNNVITIVDDNKLKIRNNALEDE